MRSRQGTALLVYIHISAKLKQQGTGRREKGKERLSSAGSASWGLALQRIFWDESTATCPCGSQLHKATSFNVKPSPLFGTPKPTSTWKDCRAGHRTFCTMSALKWIEWGEQGACPISDWRWSLVGSSGTARLWAPGSDRDVTGLGCPLAKGRWGYFSSKKHTKEDSWNAQRGTWLSLPCCLYSCIWPGFFLCSVLKTINFPSLLPSCCAHSFMDEERLRFTHLIWILRQRSLLWDRNHLPTYQLLSALAKTLEKIEVKNT